MSPQITSWLAPTLVSHLETHGVDFQPLIPGQPLRILAVSSTPPRFLPFLLHLTGSPNDIAPQWYSRRHPIWVLVGDATHSILAELRLDYEFMVDL